MKYTKQSQMETQRMSTCSWMTLYAVGLLIGMLAGCASRTRVVLISADEQVIRMPAGRAFRPRSDGYFVPDLRMRQVLERGLLPTNAVPR